MSRGLTCGMRPQDKPAAAKKSSNGKVEAAAAAPAEVKKPVKVTPKTPAVDPKQVACVIPSSLTFPAAYHTWCCTVSEALLVQCHASHSGGLPQDCAT